MTDIQAIRGRNVIALCEVTEIVPGNLGNIEKGIAFLNSIGTAARIATFRNVPILTVVHNTTVFHLHRLFRDRLDLC